MDDYDSKIAGSYFGGGQWVVGIRKSNFALRNGREGGSRKLRDSRVCPREAKSSSPDYLLPNIIIYRAIVN